MAKTPDAPAPLVPLRTSSRRDFLKQGAAAGLTAAAMLGCSEEFFQKHYKELTDDDKKRILARIEAQVRARTGVRVHVGDPPPLTGVEFAYALDLSLCTGSRRCVEACARENNVPDDPELRYIRVLEMDRGTVDLDRSDPYYEHETVPVAGKVYLPISCHHCGNPPCTKVCPTGATWKEPDGLVVVDYNWCIGCRYCIAACPYEGRRFNFREPTLRPDAINPDMAYLSNQPRRIGTIEKCTFCLQRTRKGRYPACLEACPTGARKFGNLSDPQSEVRVMLERKRVFVLKEELGTQPRFFYFFA